MTASKAYNKIFGALIKRFRIGLGLSQWDFSKRFAAQMTIAKSQSILARIESGGVDSWGKYNLEAIANVLGMQEGELFLHICENEVACLFQEKDLMPVIRLLASSQVDTITVQGLAKLVSAKLKLAESGFDFNEDILTGMLKQ